MREASAATFTVNSTGDGSDVAPGNGVCQTATAGECTLRAAIQEANAFAGSDTIAFSIAAGPQTITPLSALPTITQPVIIDGTTQPGFAGTPIIELNGSLAGPVDGLLVDAGSTTVRGLVINRFVGSGISFRIRGSNVVEGNYIGVDMTGTLDLGNGSNGLSFFGSFMGFPTGNRIGGTSAGAGNVISGNGVPGSGSAGIAIGSNASGNVIQGNFVGTSAAGTAAIPNSDRGMEIQSSNNLIGGTSSAARNVVSGNFGMPQPSGDGIGIDGFNNTGNVIQGNLLGTDVTGTFAIPNNARGLRFYANKTTVGGTAPGAGNLISGNGLDGILAWSQNSTIQGNLIGTQVDGSSPLGNGSYGVRIIGGPPNSALNNTIGGTAGGSANTIWFNGIGGVSLDQGLGHAVLGNSISLNGPANPFQGLGIELRDPLGVNPNDPGDGDSGTNNLQNFPVLTSASTSVSSTTASGTLNSTPNTTFRLEFFSNTACDPSGHGEGQTFLGFLNVTTDGSGNASFTATVGGAPAGQQVITSTATDPAGNTSEFSRCLTAAAAGPATLTLSPKTDTNTVGTPHTVTATVRDLGGNPVPGVTVRFSASGANSASGSDVTDANGEATFTYTGTTAGTDTISAFADTDNDGMQDIGEPGDTATKVWTPGAPATLTLDPPADTNTVGETHCVTATVRDAFGNPVPGVTVRFSVPTAAATAASPASGSATTDANGEATFCYGAALPGQDAIHAFADSDNDGMQDAGEPFGDATKTWILPPSTAFCEVTITEGGWIVAVNGDEASFGGNAKVMADGSVQGQQEYQDHGPAQPRNVHSIELTAVTCTDDLTSATIFGTATIDGSGTFVFRIDVSDQAEPGTSDTYGIILSDGYVSGQQHLQGGNVQIHKS